MLGTPYDVMMIIWGLIFIVAWVAFIAVMNRLFQTEERRTELLDRAGELDPQSGRQHPFHPAA